MLFDPMPYHCADNDTVHLFIKVTPKAARNRLGKILYELSPPLLKCYVTAAPENNKANKAVITLLSQWLDIAPSAITILHGHTSPIKTLSLKTDSSHVKLCLASLLQH